MAEAAKRKQQIGHARLVRDKKHSRGLIVDSGATVTLLRKTRLLRQIESRVKLAVRTATGTETTTRGKGDLVIHGCIQDGTVKKLEGTGTGHFLPELTEHGAGYITFCLDTMKSTILSVRAPLRRCCTHVLTCSADLRERSKLVDPRNRFSSLSLRASPQNLIVTTHEIFVSLSAARELGRGCRVVARPLS